MSPDAEYFVSLLAAVVASAGLAWLIATIWRRRRGATHVDDEPEGTPYRVYTSEFDQVVRGAGVDVLQSAADGGSYPPKGKNIPLSARLEETERLAAASRDVFAQATAILDPVVTGGANGIAISLLIDLSGSMDAKMPATAAAMRWFSDWCDTHSVPVAISGFTTLGWRGGAARRKWIAAGRPARPGRLCALLHVRFRDIDGTLDPHDWTAMLQRNALRENVDGEAIEWAASELKRRSEARKLLVVLSDGAPVDDSTLMENGPNYLVRHLAKVAEDVPSEGVIQLGAVGLDHWVSEYYPHSTESTDLASLPLALAHEVARLCSGSAGS